jgi:hypothetical protein
VKRKDVMWWHWSVVEREDGGRSSMVESAAVAWLQWSASCARGGVVALEHTRGDADTMVVR